MRDRSTPVLEPELQKIIVDLYTNGDSLLVVSAKSGVEYKKVRKTLILLGITIRSCAGFKDFAIPSTVQKSKYDTILNEPRCQGKMYSEYLREKEPSW